MALSQLSPWIHRYTICEGYPQDVIIILEKYDGLVLEEHTDVQEKAVIPLPQDRSQNRQDDQKASFMQELKYLISRSFLDHHNIKILASTNEFSIAVRLGHFYMLSRGGGANVNPMSLKELMTPNSPYKWHFIPEGAPQSYPLINSLFETEKKTKCVNYRIVLYNQIRLRYEFDTTTGNFELNEKTIGSLPKLLHQTLIRNNRQNLDLRITIRLPAKAYGGTLPELKLSTAEESALRINGDGGKMVRYIHRETNLTYEINGTKYVIQSIQEMTKNEALGIWEATGQKTEFSLISEVQVECGENKEECLMTMSSKLLDVCCHLDDTLFKTVV